MTSDIHMRLIELERRQTIIEREIARLMAESRRIREALRRQDAETDAR